MTRTLRIDPRRPARPPLTRGREWFLAVGLLALLAAGCGSKSKSPTGPPSSALGPEVVAVSPPARSSGVLYDTPIWVEFDRALDPRSVVATNIFFKIDAQRLPITLTYDTTAHRVRVIPATTLNLLQTYTVELSPNLRAADGTKLGSGYFFQFTTNSLRRVHPDFPAAASLDGPVSMLGWSGNGPIVANIQFDVYAGPDSAVVAQRALPRLTRSPLVTYLPHTRWPAGADTWWAVTAINVATGERLDGPVSRFRTFDANAAIDSTTVPVMEWGSNFRPNRNTQFCSTISLPIGINDYNGGMRWRVGSLPPGRRLVDARIDLYSTPETAATLATSSPTLWYILGSWSACQSSFTGAPFTSNDGQLAAGAVDEPARRVTFRSDALTAHIEAWSRYGGLDGYLLRTTNNVAFVTPLSSESAYFPVMKIYYYTESATQQFALDRAHAKPHKSR